jgi:phosphatidylglycerol:prolipoprotein diacylglycerol transferase
MPSPASPVAFSLGNLEIRWYALFLVLGMVAGIALIWWLAGHRGMDTAFPLDVAPWVVLAGLIGARLYYVVLRADYFVVHPTEAINVRLGGMTIHGALAGGTLAFVWLCRQRGQRVFTWADLIAPGIALGQAIGRWGNWANQEAFGRPTDLPWGVAIDPLHRPAAFAAATHFHPTFLYESLVDLLIAVVLAWLALRIPREPRWREGDVFWLYLISYGLVRFIIEQLRTDSLYIGPLPAALWVSAGLVAIGVIGLVIRRTFLAAPPMGTGNGRAQRVHESGSV